MDIFSKAKYLKRNSFKIITFENNTFKKYKIDLDSIE